MTPIRLKLKYRTKGGQSYKSASSNGKVPGTHHPLAGADLKRAQDISRAHTRKRVMVLRASGKVRMTDA